MTENLEENKENNTNSSSNEDEEEHVEDGKVAIENVIKSLKLFLDEIGFEKDVETNIM